MFKIPCFSEKANGKPEKKGKIQLLTIGMTIGMTVEKKFVPRLIPSRFI
jgi:hypothetical protein